MNGISPRSQLPLVLGLTLGLVAGRLGATAAELTRLTVAGARQPLWRSPHELGLPAEGVTFRAGDGVRLRGWFIRRANDDGSPAPAIVFVHGWPWNRLGNQGGNTIIPDRTVSFLEPAAALHSAGFHVLLFDLRNHGESDASLPVTFGYYEVRDFAAAVAMLRQRPEVDGRRIGAIGYSMGANTVIYGVPQCQPIPAVVAVQPTSGPVFARNFARSFVGPLGELLYRSTAPLYRALRAPTPASVEPARAAHLLGDTTVLYIQGAGDRWGSVEDVEAMAERTPKALPLVVAPSRDRFEGYQYVSHHSEEIVAFFLERL